MSKSTMERMRDLRQRREAAGMVQVNVWVPRGSEAAVREFARSLASGHGTPPRLALDALQTSATASPHPSPPQAPPAASGALRSGVYPKALIDFPEKPSAGLRHRMKAVGLVFLANYGAGHVWNGQRIEAGRFDPLVPAIRQEGGIILDPLDHA